MGAQLQRKLSYTDFEIFEEYHKIGGTWAKNTYPGLECDAGAHVSLLLLQLLSCLLDIRRKI